MSLHEFLHAIRVRTNVRIVAGWVVVAAVVTFVNDRPAAEFALLAAPGVVVPVAGALADVVGLPVRVRDAAGGLALVALSAVIVYWGVVTPAPLLVVVGAGFGLLALWTIVHRVRDPRLSTP